MKVILLEKIQNLGELGNVVTVKPGYARNFLFPQGKAKVANEENLKYYEERKAELAKRAEDLKAQAQILADQLKDVTLLITRKAMDEGKLYGSVTTLDIAQALQEKGHEISRNQVHLVDAIRELGEYQAILILHPDISTEVNVSVQSESV